MNNQENELLQKIQLVFSHRQKSEVHYTTRQNKKSDYDDVKKLMEK